MLWSLPARRLARQWGLGFWSLGFKGLEFRVYGARGLRLLDFRFRGLGLREYYLVEQTYSRRLRRLCLTSRTKTRAFDNCF